MRAIDLIFGSQVTLLRLPAWWSAFGFFICGDKLEKCCGDVGQGSNSQVMGTAKSGGLEA